MVISINAISRFSQTTNTQQLAQATQANIGKNKVQENAAKEIKNSNIVVERQDSAEISKDAYKKLKNENKPAFPINKDIPQDTAIVKEGYEKEKMENKPAFPGDKDITPDQPTLMEGNEKEKTLIEDKNKPAFPEDKDITKKETNGEYTTENINNKYDFDDFKYNDKTKAEQETKKEAINIKLARFAVKRAY